ncbi:MAG: hypothetical protein ABFQ65_03890 [Nanoarchaeota archaeon]
MKEKIIKIEIDEFKIKLIDYFKKPNFDVTLTILIKDLKLDLENLNLLQYCLDELANEGWIVKASCLGYYEYDPGEKLNFGGLK